MTVTLTAALGVVSVAAAVWSYVPAVRDIAAGAFKPCVFSWAGWAAVLAVGAAGSAGSPPVAVLLAVLAAGCALVAVLGARIPASEREAPPMVRFPGRQVRLDLVCAPGVAAGIGLLAAGSPALAVAASVATDALLYLPTYALAARDPQSQSLGTFAWSSVYALAALGAALTSGRALTYPAYLAVANTGITVLIVARRGMLPARTWPRLAVIAAALAVAAWAASRAVAILATIP